jgi:alkanesulfonate monooxygenase SsuD/methylene tetrahydromethanopterin reductase-like flavin-dependent oxidoreductase (luciferase family)
MRLELGANVDPSATGLDDARTIARIADEGGLELIGIQDHPYQRRFLDTFVLIADLLARTERVHVFPNVANLPLRGAPMIAKAAASLDVLSGGRFELGLGAGAFWDGIAAMGGPRRSPREAIDALEEAVTVIRDFWRDAGPPPAHEIAIWLGVYKPRGLALAGRCADGISISLPYAPPDEVPALIARVDEAARAAGRDPAQLRRMYNVMGDLDDPPRLVDDLVRWATELGFDTFVFWPAGEDPVGAQERFVSEVAPAVRAAVGSADRV